MEEQKGIFEFTAQEIAIIKVALEDKIRQLRFGGLDDIANKYNDLVNKIDDMIKAI